MDGYKTPAWVTCLALELPEAVYLDVCERHRDDFQRAAEELTALRARVAELERERALVEDVLGYYPSNMPGQWPSNVISHIQELEQERDEARAALVEAVRWVSCLRAHWTDHDNLDNLDDDALTGGRALVGTSARIAELRDVDAFLAQHGGQDE